MAGRRNGMEISDYIEKELISKRFLLALLLVLLFATGNVSEGLIGTVVGFYFGRSTTPTTAEVQG